MAVRWKQKLLSSAVSETKEKLATLKTAAEQANQALTNGDISKEQNRSYHIAYKKAKNPDAYFRRYESPIIIVIYLVLHKIIQRAVKISS